MLVKPRSGLDALRNVSYRNTSVKNPVQDNAVCKAPVLRMDKTDSCSYPLNWSQNKSIYKYAGNLKADRICPFLLLLCHDLLLIRSMGSKEPYSSFLCLPFSPLVGFVCHCHVCLRLPVYIGCRFV